MSNHHAGRGRGNISVFPACSTLARPQLKDFSPVFDTALKNAVHQETIPSKATGMTMPCEKGLIIIKKQKRDSRGTKWPSNNLILVFPSRPVFQYFFHLYIYYRLNYSRAIPKSQWDSMPKSEVVLKLRRCTKGKKTCLVICKADCPNNLSVNCWCVRTWS